MQFKAKCFWRLLTIWCLSTSLVDATTLVLSEKQETPESTNEKNNDQKKDNPFYEPEVLRREFIEPQFDTEDWEIGVFVGSYTFENYDAKFLSGFRISHHLTSRVFIELNAAASKLDESQRTQLGFESNLINENIEMYNLSLGFNAVNGQAFISENWAFNSQLYVVLGLGTTAFDIQTRISATEVEISKEFNDTYRFGLGYRVYLRDWITTYFEFSNYVVDTEQLTFDGNANNMGFALGFSFFY
ncbi:MAG: outer membrane beta-barrel domain-containing protein [Pseudomonadota bacterium]